MERKDEQHLETMSALENERDQLSGKVNALKGQLQEGHCMERPLHILIRKNVSIWSSGPLRKFVVERVIRSFYCK